MLIYGYPQVDGTVCRVPCLLNHALALWSFWPWDQTQPLWAGIKPTQCQKSVAWTTPGLGFRAWYKLIEVWLLPMVKCFNVNTASSSIISWTWLTYHDYTIYEKSCTLLQHSDNWWQRTLYSWAIVALYYSVFLINLSASIPPITHIHHQSHYRSKDFL